jgi:DNA-binding transcriptional LysR family regulator
VEDLYILIGSAVAVAMMVDQGLGVGLVPDIGSVLAQGREVCALALPDGSTGSGSGGTGDRAPDARKVGLLWLNTSARARWARSLLDCARQCLG